MRLPAVVINPVGCAVTVLLFNLTVGYLSVQYILVTFTGAAAPWFGALVGGLILGQLTVPVAMGVWLLQSVGVTF